MTDAHRHTIPARLKEDASRRHDIVLLPTENLFDLRCLMMATVRHSRGPLNPPESNRIDAPSGRQ